LEIYFRFGRKEKILNAAEKILRYINFSYGNAGPTPYMANRQVSVPASFAICVVTESVIP